MHHKTIHQFTTGSADCAKAVRILLQDPRCRDILAIFARIRSPKRRNLVLRLASYLAEGERDARKVGNPQEMT